MNFTVVHLMDEAGYVFLDRYVDGDGSGLPEVGRYRGDTFRIRLRVPGHVWYRVV